MLQTKRKGGIVGRTNVVDHQGGQIYLTLLVVPYPHDATVSTGNYFTPSFENVSEVTKGTVLVEIRKECWNGIFPTVSEKELFTKAVSHEKMSSREFVRPFRTS